MPLRFATEEQVTQVAGYAAGIAAYQATLNGILTTIAGFVEAFSPDSGIETRIITGEGRDDELWRGNLLSASPTKTRVDVWCLTVTNSKGLPFGQNETVGSFDKARSIGLDYFYDYYFGTDKDNSEAVFNAKIDGLDYIFEQIRTCLPDNAEIVSWNFRRMVKRFNNASTHIARGDLELRINDL
jgi:hypothetical protein